MTRAIYYLAALALFAFALVVATQTVSGVTWPCEIDFYRDMGAAQGLLDGRLFEDSAYLGEIRWYNPLLPAVYATITAALDLPLNEVVARSGPVLNLLGPVFFYLLALSLMGPLAALAALVAYLFLGNHSEPSWFHATYSPWAWPMNFTQGIAFAAFLAYLRARRRPGIVREALAGAILGVTAPCGSAP